MKMFVLFLLFFFSSFSFAGGCSGYQNSQSPYEGKVGKITSVVIFADKDKAAVNYSFSGIVHKTTINVDEVDKFPVGMSVYFIPWDRVGSLSTGEPINYWLMSNQGDCPLIGKEKIPVSQIEEAIK